MNAIKTVLLLGTLTALLILIGGMIAGKGGLIVALIFAGIMNFTSYFFSDKIALSMYRAQPVTIEEAPELYEIVEYLSQKAGIPTPRIYIIPQEAPNAFATGRNPENAVIAVTEGALRLLSEEELMGVLGHEIGHVKHRDILISSIAATIAGAIMVLANMMQWAAIFGGFSRDQDSPNPLILLVTALVAPIAATLIQLAISRAREYSADRAGAIYSGNPLYLAHALEKLEAYSQRIRLQGSPTTEHMFIINPFKGQNLATLFSTHPPTEERIKRLIQMAKEGA